MQAEDLPCMRLPLPLAYADPAFMKCLDEAIELPELVQQFDRLCKCSLSAARKDDMRKFVEFVHDGIYLRLPDEAIHSLRVKALAQPA